MVEINPKLAISGIIGVVMALLVAITSSSIIEQVSETETVVKRGVMGGMVVYFDPGPKWQMFGTMTSYPKSSQYWFSADDDEGGDHDESFPVKFNDNGGGFVSGSARIDLPGDEVRFLEMHNKYHNMKGIRDELVKPNIRKAVFAAGAMMSSKDAITSQRNRFVRAIEDQAINGIYKTYTEKVVTKDPITGNEVTSDIVKVVKNETAPNGIARDGESELAKYGIYLKVNISDVVPDKKVADQLGAQQKILMDIQKAKAKAQLAEQDKLTAERQGQAEAETAKWTEMKAKIVAETRAEKEASVAKINAEREVAVEEFSKQKAEVAASKKLEVAKLDRKAAEEDAAALLAKASAEAKANTLKVKAGATPQEILDAQVQIEQAKWNGVSKIKLPEFMMTGGGNGSGSDGFDAFIKMLMAEKAQSLGKVTSKN